MFSAQWEEGMTGKCASFNRVGFGIGVAVILGYVVDDSF